MERKSNMSEYEKQLEKRISELEEIISKSIAPTPHGVLKFLIEEKKRRMKAASSQIDLMSSQNVLRDLTTLKFNLGRQGGHTTTMEKLHKENPTSILINYYRTGGSGTEWTKFKSTYREGGKRIQTDMILADDFLYEDIRLRELYNVIASCRDKSLPYPLIVVT
jgi:hypothetical protein